MHWIVNLQKAMTTTICDCCAMPCKPGAFRHRLEGIFSGVASVSVSVGFEHNNGFGEMCHECWANLISTLSNSLAREKLNKQEDAK